MRVVVDFSTCESHGKCVEAAPTVFEVRDDLCLYLLDETPDEALRPAVEEAARLCPTASIFIVDEPAVSS